MNRASAPKARSCGRPDGEERRTINKENEERELQVYIGDAVGVPGDSIKALLLGRKPINGATARLSRPCGNYRISQACPTPNLDGYIQISASISAHQSVGAAGSGSIGVDLTSSPVWHSNGRNRRVSPVAPRPREGPLTEPTAGAQPWPRERVLMPLKRPWRRDREPARWVVSGRSRFTWLVMTIL